MQMKFYIVQLNRRTLAADSNYKYKYCRTMLAADSNFKYDNQQLQIQ